jgi:hypothetical protein
VKAPGDSSFTHDGTDSSPGATGTIDYTAGDDGSYEFYTVATDNAGNVEDAPVSADQTTVVDTHAPAPTLDSVTSPTNDNTPNLSGSAGTQASDDSHTADDNTVTVEIWNGAGADTSNAPGRVISGVNVSSGSWSLANGDYSSTPLSDGSYTVRVSQSDGAGNAGHSSTQDVKVDTAAPAPTLGAVSSPTNDNTPNLSGSAGTQSSDDSHSADAGTVSVQIWNGASADTSTAPDRTISGVSVDGSGNWSLQDSDYASTPLGDGSYTVRVSQGDDAGNAGHSAAQDLKVDTQAPAPTLGAVSSPTNDNKPNLSGTAGTQASDAGHSADAGTVSVQIWKGASADTSTAPDRTISGVSVDGSGNWALQDSDYGSTPLADGSYTVRVVQSDGAGNTGHSAAQNLSVDSTAPNPSVTSPADGGSTNDTTPNASGSAGTASGDNSTVTVQLWSGSSASGTPDRTFSGIAVDGSGHWALQDTDYDTGTPSKAPLTEGQWTIRVDQGDNVGNTGQSATHTFRVDTTAPAITSSNDGQTYSKGDNVAADYTCTDSNSGVATCNGSVAKGSSLDTSSIGDHTFTVNATDNAGNSSAITVTYHVVGNADSNGGSGGSNDQAPPQQQTQTQTLQQQQVDTTPPTVTVAGGAKTLTIASNSNSLDVPVKCNEGCTVVTDTTISLPGAAKVYRLKKLTVTLAAGQSKVMRIKLSSKLAKLVKKALANHKKVTATIVVTATDSAGHRTVSKRVVKLKLAKKK